MDDRAVAGGQADMAHAVGWIGVEVVDAPRAKDQVPCLNATPTYWLAERSLLDGAAWQPNTSLAIKILGEARAVEDLWSLVESGTPAVGRDSNKPLGNRYQIKLDSPEAAGVEDAHGQVRLDGQCRKVDG